MNARMHRRNQAGFTLIETMIATLVLSIGLLGMVGILAQGLAYMNVSQYEYIAQQKASETIESIFTARDQGQAHLVHHLQCELDAFAATAFSSPALFPCAIRIRTEF